MSETEIADVASLTHAAMRPGGTCLLVNWTGPNDMPVDGETAIALFERGARWRTDRVAVAAGSTYRIDRFVPVF